MSVLPRVSLSAKLVLVQISILLLEYLEYFQLVVLVSLFFLSISHGGTLA